MSTLKASNWLYLIVISILAILMVIGFLTMTGAARASIIGELQSQRPTVPNDVIEVFTNTWSYSTIGLVYDPGRDSVCYAHESQSSRHKPTIYDVDQAALHFPSPTIVLSFALSTRNSGWPWQIDNRNGVGYDYVADTYFLPDYNGDLSYVDDNIVEIRPDGTILNAWEMDDEVGSNDSVDGSEIDSIVDIAVVPGNPTRYFVAAAYDSGVVYEISLRKTGNWWTPNSWSTVATYTLPPEYSSDNVGIDYDAEYGRLFHSDWHTTTILITDLSMNLIATIDCPGAGGYNTGVTYLEGSNPPEVWVTDYNSDKTTRCTLPGEVPPPPSWEKTVDGNPWVADLEITKETWDVFEILDVITTSELFTLTEQWDESRLQLIALIVEPPLAEVITDTGTLMIRSNAASPDNITINKIYRVQPSTWTQTVFSETLESEGANLDERFFTVLKQAPQLSISSDYRSDVYAGSVTTFTLTYANTGGLENDVVITNTFPISAPMVYASPLPDSQAANGTWARWDVGDLAAGEQGSIDVYVYIPESASVGEQITFWDGIYNHLGVLADEVESIYTVQSDALSGWTKTIEGVSWFPGISATKQTSETITVVDVVDFGSAFILAEAWIPSELGLAEWSIEPLSYASFVLEGPAGLTFSPPLPMEPITLTKVFTIETCSWPQTILWEQLSFGANLFTGRPVLVNKELPILEIESLNPNPEINGGETVSFKLTYSNTGGLESAFQVGSEFPTDVSFVSSNPVPTSGGAGDPNITWDFPAGLSKDQIGEIEITIQFADEIPPATVLEVMNTIYDHMGQPQDTVTATYSVAEPEWQKNINDDIWYAEQRTLVDVGDIFTVTDVITSDAAFELVDSWNGDHLRLLSAIPSDGAVVDVSGLLTWTVPSTAPSVVTLTKRFQVEVFTTTHTVLWENLFVGGVEWERRPVFLERPTPDLMLTKLATPAIAAPGDAITYTLSFSNAGPGTAAGVVITDHVPSDIIVTSVISSGVRITDTAASPPYVWQVENLGENQGGVITITGTLDPFLSDGIIENIVEISAINDLVVGGSTSPDHPERITASAYITIDDTDPTISITDPLNGQILTGTRYAIQGLSADNLVLDHVEVSTDGGLTWNDALGTNGWSYQWTLPVGENGITHTLLARAVDSVGHIQASLPVEVMVDTVAPQVLAVYPPNAAQGVPVQANIVISFTEAIIPSSLVLTFSDDPGGWDFNWSANQPVVIGSHDAFQPATVIDVTLMACDLAGNPLEEPYVWQFNTALNQIYLPFVIHSVSLSSE